MAKAIDNIKAWAKENVQLITILPENTILKVDTRLKDVLETSVDEKYYLSDEKTALLVAKLEGEAVTGESFILDTKPKDAFRIYKDTCPKLQANDYKEPKQVVEQTPIIAGSLEHYGNDQMNRVYHTHGISPTVTVVSGGGREQKIAERIEVKQLGNVNPSGRGMNGAVYDINAGLSPTLTTNKGEGQRIAEAPYYRIRKLTPLECFRLQSFPDWAFHEAAEVNSNSQLYRQAGNSVTVNVIHEIAKRL